MAQSFGQLARIERDSNQDEPKNRRILIVDDLPEIHNDFRKVLERKAADSTLERMEEDLFGPVEGGTPAAKRVETYEIDSAFQGAQAVARVREMAARGEHYSIAFVDMRMPPGWDGVETIRQLWRIDPEIQIVICTAYSDYTWQQILVELGVTDRLLILRKPFDTTEVCQLACALTEKWRLARQAQLKLSQLRSMVEEKTSELRLGYEQLRNEIAERRQIESALRASEARYALAAAGANDGLWDWDLVADTIYLSPRWRSALDLSDVDVGDNPEQWFVRIHGADLPGVRETVAAHLRGDTDHLEMEYRILDKAGRYRWMLCRGVAVRDADGKAIRMAGSQTDVTDRRLAEEHLRHDALHDSLTGLANRALLQDRLRLALARAKRDPEFRFAVLFGDLDRFKVINDSLGHAVGDKVLVGIGQRLVHGIRATDVLAHFEQNAVARLGGDEFVVLLEGLRSPEDALRVGRRLQDALTEPFTVEGKEVFSGMSIGIAVGRPDYECPEDVLRDADTALYQAKARGRGSCEFFDSGMHATAMSRWWLENSLRRAIERDELRLVYQPIVCLRTGALREFEALLRWQHPERGAISPADFIPVAEDTGLIAAVGDWVLASAADQLAQWRHLLARRPDFSVAVNVSSRQLSQPAFGGRLGEVLETRALDANRIRIEVTESTLMEKAGSSELLAKIVALDIKLHLDDFGTGYSSLNYLHRLPVDALKIDRSFVSAMVNDATSASIVQSIIALAHALRAEVIAEGVETEAQLDMLRGFDCDLAQGFLLARPLEADRATSLLECDTDRLVPGRPCVVADAHHPDPVPVPAPVKPSCR